MQGFCAPSAGVGKWFLAGGLNMPKVRNALRDEADFSLFVTLSPKSLKRHCGNCLDTLVCECDRFKLKISLTSRSEVKFSEKNVNALTQEGSLLGCSSWYHRCIYWKSQMGSSLSDLSDLLQCKTVNIVLVLLPSLLPVNQSLLITYSLLPP